MFSLIYLERPISSTTKSSLHGPFFFTEKNDAVKMVFDYSAARILDSAVNFFVNNYLGLE
jgi:hypothetical protein